MAVIENQAKYTRIRVGFMIAAVFTMSILTGLGGYKYVPMQTTIMDFFRIGESSYGYLNTAAGWVSVFCSIPFAFLVRKMRCNFTVIIGLAVAICGVLVQASATEFTWLLIGRIIEGTGTGFSGLVTGSLILNLVSKKRVAFWSGVMIMTTVLPQVVMAKGGTALMQNSGLPFQSIFRIVAAIYGLALILWVAMVPFSLKITGVGSDAKPTREQTIRVIKNKSNWLIAIANTLYSLASMTFVSYIIRYLTMKGMTQAEAANIYSYTTILGLFAMVAFGFISDKLKTKRKIAIMSFISGAGALCLLALLPANLIVIYIVVWGTLPRSIAGMTNASAADIAELPADIPIVNSIRGTIQHVGSIVTGILLGYMLQWFGYDISIFVMAGGLLVGAVLWIFAKRIP